MWRAGAWCVVAFALMACDGDEGKADGNADGEAASTAPSDSSATDPGDDADATADGESGEPFMSDESLRFVAFGDSGEGNEAQYAVAVAAERVCEERGCDLALLLGDNFYDVGVTAVDDVQFVDKFELPYEGLDLPFYVVLGNHDYGTLALDWERGHYAQTNPKWNMPAFWYSFSSESGQTQFFALDTQRIMNDHQQDEQREWLEGELAASTAPWKVAFAHHPYISNGEHGNAGNYEGRSGLLFISGELVRRFVSDLVCGNVDMYISGHDHNRQAFDPVCGTYFFVSGAAAKTTGFEFRDENPTAWGDDQREGFTWVEIEGTEMTVAFYDLDGNLDHETFIQK